MFMQETLAKLADEFEREPEEITGRDIVMAQISLDPDEARFHPNISRRDDPEVESDIDAIYAAAQAGNRWANLLIHYAACNQITAAHNVDLNGALLATDVPVKPLQEELDWYDAEAAYKAKQTEPALLPGSIFEIDRSLAIIELTIENVRQDLVEE